MSVQQPNAGPIQSRSDEGDQDPNAGVAQTIPDPAQSAFPVSPFDAVRSSAFGGVGVK